MTRFCLFYFIYIHRSGVLTAPTCLVPHETGAVSAQVLCTPYNHAPCHFMQSHIRKVYACLVVTCKLRFWQNDRDLLRATAVTRGWNGYRNKSQHRKSTLEKKIPPPLLQGFEPTTFQSRVRRSNHGAIPAPGSVVVSASECGSEGLGFESYQSQCWIFQPRSAPTQSCWNHTAEFKPLRRCVFEGVTLIPWPTLQEPQFPG